MKQSQFFLKTSKTVSEDEVAINARLLERGGFISKNMAGVYNMLPLGLRVLNKIENIIREEINKLGASEVLMTGLQPKENWQTTGRYDSVDILYKVKSQHGYEVVLGPTHEEIVTPLVGRWVSSYKDLPLGVFQIQTKFRDEARAKSGLLRGREFRMKDLYSFHASEQDFEEYYKKAQDAYFTIFKRIGLDALLTEADGGSFSKFSHEYQVEIENGEDIIHVCTGCNLAKNKEVYTEGSSCTNCGKAEFREAKASEVGNIFPLKDKFTSSFNVQFTDQEGNKQPVLMGCYGIGSTRCMGVVVEKFNDDKGIIWPKEVAPFTVHLVALYGKESETVKQEAEKVYNQLVAAGVEVLFDDREDVSAGEKFSDSDLIGIPFRVVVSEKSMSAGGVEVKKRRSADSQIIGTDKLVGLVK